MKISYDKNKAMLTELLEEKVKLKGIETVVTVGDFDRTMLRSELNKATIHPFVTIIGDWT